jgi:hypothetical protein
VPTHFGPSHPLRSTTAPSGRPLAAAQAMDRLKAAEKAQGAAQRELTREALQQLQQVPLACNLDFLTAQLTRLHYYEVRAPPAASRCSHLSADLV